MGFFKTNSGSWNVEGSVDYYEEKNKNYLYVHWLDSTTDDGKKAAKIIKGKFEKYIGRIFD